jgi:hypothetical protein
MEVRFFHNFHVLSAIVGVIIGLILYSIFANPTSGKEMSLFALTDNALMQANVDLIWQIKKIDNEISANYARDSLNETIREIYGQKNYILAIGKDVKDDINTLKEKLISMSGGYDDGSRFYGVPMLIEHDNTSYAMKILDVQGDGPMIRKSLNSTRKEWLKVLAEMEEIDDIREDDPLGYDSTVLNKAGVKIIWELPEMANQGGKHAPWHYHLVNEVPMAAVMPTITQLENDILRSELEILLYLKSKLE